MGSSRQVGTSILMGFSIINYPFGDTMIMETPASCKCVHDQTCQKTFEPPAVDVTKVCCDDNDFSAATCRSIVESIFQVPLLHFLRELQPCLANASRP